MYFEYIFQLHEYTYILIEFMQLLWGEIPCDPSGGEKPLNEAMSKQYTVIRRLVMVAWDMSR